MKTSLPEDGQHQHAGVHGGQATEVGGAGGSPHRLPGQHSERQDVAQDASGAGDEHDVAVGVALQVLQEDQVVGHNALVGGVADRADVGQSADGAVGGGRGLVSEQGPDQRCETGHRPGGCHHRGGGGGGCAGTGMRTASGGRGGSARRTGLSVSNRLFSRRWAHVRQVETRSARRGGVLSPVKPLCWRSGFRQAACCHLSKLCAGGQGFARRALESKRTNCSNGRAGVCGPIT